MGAIAAKAAIGSALFFICVLVIATVFCQMALRDGGEFEAEIKAPSLALRLRAAGAHHCSGNTTPATGQNTTRTGQGHR
jgi:hypothetical protein